MSEKKISERAQKILDLLCLLNPCHPGLSSHSALDAESKIPHQVRDDKHRNDEILASGQIWIRQATLAEHFGCSRTTIGRAIKELKEAGLMTELSQKYLNRYKTYSLCHSGLSSHPSLELGSRIPGQARDDKHRDDETTSPAAPRHDDNVLPMSLSDVRLDEPAQVVRDKNEIEALLAKHGAEWQRRHPYFGTGDKPTLRRWVFNMGLYGKPFRLRAGKNLEEWIESMFITTEKWAVEWAMAIVERQKREQQEQQQR